MHHQAYTQPRILLPVQVELSSHVSNEALGEFLQQGVSYVHERTGKRIHGTCHGILHRPATATEENPNGLQVYIRGFDDLYLTQPANLVTFTDGKNPNDLLVEAPREPSRLSRIAKGVLRLVRPTAG